MKVEKRLRPDKIAFGGVPDSVGHGQGVGKIRFRSPQTSSNHRRVRAEFVSMEDSCHCLSLPVPIQPLYGLKKRCTIQLKHSGD